MLHLKVFFSVEQAEGNSRYHARGLKLAVEQRKSKRRAKNVHTAKDHQKDMDERKRAKRTVERSQF